MLPSKEDHFQVSLAQTDSCTSHKNILNSTTKVFIGFHVSPDHNLSFDFQFPGHGAVSYSDFSGTAGVSSGPLYSSVLFRPFGSCCEEQNCHRRKKLKERSSFYVYDTA